AAAVIEGITMITAPRLSVRIHSYDTVPPAPLVVKAPVAVTVPFRQEFALPYAAYVTVWLAATTGPGCVAPAGLADGVGIGVGLGVGVGLAVGDGTGRGAVAPQVGYCAM